MHLTIKSLYENVVNFWNSRSFGVILNKNMLFGQFLYDDHKTTFNIIILPIMKPRILSTYIESLCRFVPLEFRVIGLWLLQMPTLRQPSYEWMNEIAIKGNITFDNKIVTSNIMGISRRVINYILETWYHIYL